MISHYFRRRVVAGFAALSGLMGCNAVRNGWLDPTVVGNFEETATLEIRSSLTIEDSSSAIPGSAPPLPKDHELIAREYPISAGDTFFVEIHELRQRDIPFQAQIQISATGEANIPVVGRIPVAGLTPAQFEETLRQTLRERDILREPQVTVSPQFLQKATYSIFGIGVSAAENAPLRAGTFPIRRPDMRLLEAINLVGGLNEFVTDVYIFRDDNHAVDQTGEPAEPPLQPEGPNTELPSQDAPPAGETRPLDGPLPLAPHASRKHRFSEPSRMTGIAAADGSAEPRTRAVTQALLATALAQEEPPTKMNESATASQPPPGAGDESAARKEPPPEEFLPDPTQPFLYDPVKGEFVPNPAFVHPEPQKQQQPAEFDTAMPAVNWARVAGESHFRVIRVFAQGLRTGDPAANIYVRAGDVIRVVSGEIGVYYVMGQVNRVGAFPFNAEPITLKAAIANAGGLSALAWPDRCTVYRQVGQREQMLQVNLDRIFAGKDPDFYIKRGDIINVGTHPFAPFLRQLRALTIPNPVNNVGFSFTYARNFADIDSFAVQQNPANRPDRFPLLFP